MAAANSFNSRLVSQVVSPSTGAAKKYSATAMGVMNWAKSELEHVGRIAAVKDTDIQYSYALSTVNSMLHLRDALVELINDPYYIAHKEDLTRTHDSVIRVVKKLISDYSVNIETIRAFNTRKVLGNLTNFQQAPPPAALTSSGVVNARQPANARQPQPNARQQAVNARQQANARPKAANARPVSSPWYWPF
jgi:hypothetical protein